MFPFVFMYLDCCKGDYVLVSYQFHLAGLPSSSSRSADFTRFSNTVNKNNFISTHVHGSNKELPSTTRPHSSFLPLPSPPPLTWQSHLLPPRTTTPQGNVQVDHKRVVVSWSSLQGITTPRSFTLRGRTWRVVGSSRVVPLKEMK